MATGIKARRALSELFKEGVEVRFWRDPETKKPMGDVGPFVDKDGRRTDPGDATVLWVQPPNPIQRDLAMREGQARRARALVKAKRDENSEEHLTIMAFLADMSDETLVDYVIANDTNERMAEAEREVLQQDKWKEMTSYQDAMRQFEEMSDEEREADPEWQALLEMDENYSREVAQRELQLQDAQRDALKFLARDLLEKKALDRRAELVGNQAFVVEYERQMRFYSVREFDDTEQLAFETPNDLASRPDELIEVLAKALRTFIAEVGDAKNSPRVASGSDSSELPSEPETSEASTLVGQSA